MLSAVVLGCSGLATGCLVAEAPEYGPPQQRPPVIDALSVQPSPYELQVFDSISPQMRIDVPFRSEDAGENVVAVLYVDWDPTSSEEPNLITDRTIPASSFDQLDRKFSYEWLPGERTSRECGHTATLLLLHESNYDDPLPKQGVKWDIASITWQLNVYPDPVDPSIIQVCSGAGASIN